MISHGIPQMWWTIRTDGRSRIKSDHPRTEIDDIAVESPDSLLDSRIGLE